uniref:rhomboid protease n=1 Tax=Strigamia maritima TaxID=126957 RepID=T1JLF4_STRMM
MSWGIQGWGCCGIQKQIHAKYSCVVFNSRKLLTPNQSLQCNIGHRSFRNSKRPTRTFQNRLAPVVENVVISSPMGLQRLIKPFCFTVLVGACSFTGATIWQYENVHKQVYDRWQRNAGIFQNELALPRKTGGYRREMNSWWNQRTEGQKVAFSIIGLNTAVFLLWRVPALRPVMVKYFCSNPAAKAVCWPMLLSTFSHFSPWHLAANMYVMYTFSTSVVNFLGKEQFVAFYLTAGTFSSFLSYVHKVVMRVPSMSLGASGAIMGVLAAVCVQMPTAKLAIVFLPWFTFSASAALKGLILLDTTGLVLRWSLFDHAAHLGGALFGIGYMAWGNELIWKRREPLIRWWHSIRKSSEE